MENQSEIAGADKEYARQANGSYVDIVASIGACMLAISNNRQAITFTDNNGVPLKTMQDASGDGVIPANSVVITDLSGRATYNSEFTFDGSSLRLPIPFTFNIGDPTVNGSWQIVITTTSISFQHRVSGAWKTDVQELF